MYFVLVEPGSTTWSPVHDWMYRCDPVTTVSLNKMHYGGGVVDKTQEGC